MSKERAPGQCARALRAAIAALAVGAVAVAQKPAEADSRAHRQDPNGAATRPTHRPKPRLHPLRAWNFVKTGNEAYVAQREAQKRVPRKAQREPRDHHSHAPAPATTHPLLRRPTRPAGAGRYVCAVLACADLDVDLPAMLGVHARDLLTIRTPGPFVHRETTALLERLVREHRLSLVLVLGHEPCPSLQPRRDRVADALTQRAEALRRLTANGKYTLAEVLVRRQRELILSASDALEASARKDELRVVPGLVDPATGAIHWRASKAELMPVAPVR